ncbi:MAG: hypothetical protein JST93_15485 [Acidobacteria bacterium]|nr:hypothetical protein [Acidobacteriota bacterium]
MRIAPLGDVEELLAAYAAVLENAGPPDEIERVLDGVSRMCGQRGAGLGLAEKAEKFLKAPALYAVSGVFDGRWDPRYGLCALALAWIRQEPARASKACHGLGSFLTGRVAEVAARAVEGHAKPLVGVPSHAGSWVDPMVLVERLHEHPEPDRLDLIQALLRLSVRGREEALERGRSLPGPVGRIVRFALGSDDCRRPPRFYDEALWLAAGQARDPEGGAGVHRLRWAMNREAGFVRVEMESWPAVEMDAAKPAALTAVPGVFDASMLRWCATVWPAHREEWFAAGALAIGRNLEWESAEWGNRVYLETLAEYRGAYGPMAYELLALGLASKETGEGLVACDALVAGLRDGRVSGERLGETCARLAGEGVVDVGRWVRRFAAVPGHDGELFLTMDGLVAGGVLRAEVLELLLELRRRTAGVLSAEARARVAGGTGRGKVGRLRDLLLG